MVVPRVLFPGPAHGVRRLTGLLSRLQRSAYGYVMHLVPSTIVARWGAAPPLLPAVYRFSAREVWLRKLGRYLKYFLFSCQVSGYLYDCGSYVSRS